MTLKELQLVVNMTIDYLHDLNPEEIPVLITLSEPSWGARASVSVKYAGMGGDWEKGQFRLEPTKELVIKGNNLTDVKPVVCRQYDGRNYYFCPRCTGRVAKNDCYCRYCGQKLREKKVGKHEKTITERNNSLY